MKNKNGKTNTHNTNQEHRIYSINPGKHSGYRESEIREEKKNETTIYLSKFCLSLIARFDRMLCNQIRFE